MTLCNNNDQAWFSDTLLTCARPLGSLNPCLSGSGFNTTLGVQQMLMHKKTCLIPILLPSSGVNILCCVHVLWCSSLFSAWCDGRIAEGWGGGWIALIVFLLSYGCLCSVSLSLWCHGLICGLWLLYFLAIVIVLKLTSLMYAPNASHESHFHHSWAVPQERKLRVRQVYKMSLLIYLIYEKWRKSEI